MKIANANLSKISAIRRLTLRTNFKRHFLTIYSLTATGSWTPCSSSLKLPWSSTPGASSAIYHPWHWKASITTTATPMRRSLWCGSGGVKSCAAATHASTCSNGGASHEKAFGFGWRSIPTACMLRLSHCINWEWVYDSLVLCDRGWTDCSNAAVLCMENVPLEIRSLHTTLRLSHHTQTS